MLGGLVLALRGLWAIGFVDPYHHGKTRASPALLSSAVGLEFEGYKALTPTKTPPCTSISTPRNTSSVSSRSQRSQQRETPSDTCTPRTWELYRAGAVFFLGLVAFLCGAQSEAVFLSNAEKIVSDAVKAEEPTKP